MEKSTCSRVERDAVTFRTKTMILAHDDTSHKLPKTVYQASPNRQIPISLGSVNRADMIRGATSSYDRGILLFLYGDF